MPQAIYILFGSVLTVTAAWAAGVLLFRRALSGLNRLEQNVLAFSLGSVVLSLVIFALAVAHAVYKPVLLGLMATLIALAARRPLQGERAPAGPWWFRALYALFALVYFVNAMAPEISPDGMVYHLGLVAKYARARGFVAVPENLYASLSQGIELLFLPAFVFGRHSAAALVHCAFLFALPLAMSQWARRAGLGVAGYAAALLVFLSPVVGVDGISAYVDVALACQVFCLFVLVERWQETRERSLLAAIGLLAGFSYAVKYTAAVIIPYAFARVRRWRVALWALVPVVPWLVKNAVTLGNPVAPFFNGLFPNPHLTPAFEAEYAAYLRHYGLTSLWSIPWEAAVRGKALTGLLGPVFLLAPIALLALRKPVGRRLLAAAAVPLLTYPLNIGTRFLIPALPFVALAMSMVAGRTALALVVFHAVLSWPYFVRSFSHRDAWTLWQIPWKQALRIEDEETWLNRTRGEFRIARMIETFVPPGEKVFVFGPTPEAYTTREIWTSYFSEHSWQIRDLLILPCYAPLQPNVRLRWKFAPRSLRSLRIEQRAAGKPDRWLVHEVLAGRPVKVTASDRPWDAGAMTDGNPLTFWRAGRTATPGMFLDLDFGGPAEVGEIALLTAGDLYGLDLRIFGESPVRTEEPLPPDLRRRAAAEVRRRGLRYFVIGDGDFGWRDFRDHSSEWGVTKLAERGNTFLYRID